MRLLLIRHGQSLDNLAWNAGMESIGDEDSPMTDLGHSQAASLAQAFRDGLLPKPDHLMSSLMVRAVQTVAPIAQALDQQVTGLVKAYEVGGVYRTTDSYESPYPGLKRAELLQCCPNLVLPPVVTDEGWYFRSIEPRIEAWSRAERVISRLMILYGNSNDLVALVSHGMFIQLLWRVLVGWQPNLSTPLLDAWFCMNNTGTVFLSSPGDFGEKASIYWINRTDHLSPDQLTN